MFFILGILQMPNSSLSEQTATSTPTLDNLPRLIALEPTSIPPQATETLIHPTSTIDPPPTRIAATASSTPTALFLLHDQQPDIIGYSMEGRPLEVYTFGNGERERMIVAGIHGGDEWNTITLANQLIVHLNQNPDVIPEEVTLYILPNLNPDGEARAHNKYGRLNHNGVDLNRNFPINWRADWERGGCWNYLRTSGGAEAGSEPETRVLMDFIDSQDIDALISYHSAALGVFPGGEPRDGDSIRLAESIAQVGTYPYPPLDTGCIYSGSLPDFAVSRGIAAVDLELTNHIDTDFDQNLKVLNVLLDFAP